jgi:drug/metabolite transporter (DMT)-like permease
MARSAVRRAGPLATGSVLTGSLLALIAASLFGTLGPLSRIADDAGVGPLAFVAWRAGIGTVALAAGMAAAGRLPRVLRAMWALDRRSRASLALAAFMGYTLNVAIFVAFDRITIALALMLFYTYPALVAAVEVATGREALTPPRALALGLASFGALLVLFGGVEGGLTFDALGIALAFSAALSQTVFIAVSRTGYSALPAEGGTLVILITSGVGALLTAIAVGAGADLVAPFTAAGAWPPILIAGILAAGLASFLFLTSLRRIGGTRTGILMLWEPVVGVILAAAILGESLVLIQVLGGVMVLGAALILQLSSRPELEPVAPRVEIV